ncbi:ornithine cyclodeaminase [Roseovarius aestuarii]|uniref:Ornithine cyclodeaminase n=1 Tax=Roseovarius aestuarii TaxID=475083 RepID=A0A1X7BXZ5_9RHOB|nr:ornithine cyclodeaminase [Roseovarius aestuarii]SMC14370.1 ornithine cyclodeaminase [Roseovarius aestuarii]
MQMFDAEAVHRLLPYDELIPALQKLHEGEMPAGDGVYTNDPAGTGNMFVTLPGWLGERLIVVKMVGVFPANRDRDPPIGSVLGAVAAFDSETGAPVLVADGEAMTYRKTAAVSGLGTALLAPPEPQELLVVGAGGLGPHVAMAHIAARPSITRVQIWNRTASRAEALATTLRMQGINAKAASDLDAAVTEADVISSVTMSRAPLVKGALLKPGAHLDLVGSYLPDMRETDDDAMRRAAVYTCCDRGRDEVGELILPVASGALSWDDIRGDAFGLVQGRTAGRTSEDQITVYKNIGGAHQDVFTAVILKQAAGL